MLEGREGVPGHSSVPRTLPGGRTGLGMLGHSYMVSSKHRGGLFFHTAHLIFCERQVLMIISKSHWLEESQPYCSLTEKMRGEGSFSAILFLCLNRSM